MKRDMKKTEKRIAAILLAAGRSRRMGRDKLALPWGDKTVFERCLDTLLYSKLAEITVVVSDESKTFRNQLATHPAFLSGRMRYAQNPSPERGMSFSIRRGLRKVSRGIQGVLITLGDQPLLKGRTINTLVRAFTPGEGRIVVPFYKGKRGNPVLFDRCYIDELSQLRGDVGGRSVIKSHPDKVIRVRTRSEGVVRDIDTLKAYRDLKARRSKFSRKDE